MARQPDAADAKVGAAANVRAAHSVRAAWRSGCVSAEEGAMTGGGGM
ncbi:hypothetical protein GmRootV35_20090 [Variovorax sp. V35]